MHDMLYCKDLFKRIKYTANLEKLSDEMGNIAHENRYYDQIVG